MIKRITDILRKLITFFVAIIVAYLISAIILSLAKTHPPKQDCPAENAIFITSNGIHLDIVLPIENIETGFLKNLKILPGTNYVAFGWGDRRFYLDTPEWKDLTFSTAFNALLLKSETAMHVTCYRQKYTDWKPVQLCPAQFDVLHQYIEGSFQQNEDGTLMKIPVKGYFDNDFFYEAIGSFSPIKTCNVWVNRALKEAGVETSVWSPFDVGVLWHLKE